MSMSVGEMFPGTEAALVSLTSVGTDAESWKRRWSRVREKLRASEAENARLRAALDELNADVEEFLNVAHQAGHEAAKSHMIRQQMATIRSMRARLRELAPSGSSAQKGAEA